MNEHDDERDTEPVRAGLPVAHVSQRDEIAAVLAEGLEKVAIAIDDGLHEIAQAILHTPKD